MIFRKRLLWQFHIVSLAFCINGYGQVVNSPKQVIISKAEPQMIVLATIDLRSAFPPYGNIEPSKGHFTTAIFASEDTIKNISGRVLGQDLKPFAGATITLQNGKGYSTNNNGEFSFPFLGRTSMLITNIGYRDTTVVVDNPNLPLTIVLSANNATQQLEEVKVTALGLTKKTNAVGYSIAEISGDAVQTAKEPNFVNALQGKLAGVQINTNNGSLGGSTKILIRGNKSITGNNNALFVVDGIFMGNSSPIADQNQQKGGGGYDYGSPIQDINPDDIDQISVLKGAAATALYGSRGSNGVVLITTKKGSSRKGLGITYNMNAQIDQVYYLPKFQNRYGGGGSSNAPDFVASGFDTLWQSKLPDLFLNKPTYNDPVKGGYDLLPQYSVDESWGPELKGQIIRAYYSFDKNKGNPYFGITTPWLPQPNNIRDFYETGVTLTNSISVGGSNDRGSFRLAYSNLNQNFILPNSLLERNNFGFNGTHNLTKNRNLSVVVSANYSENFVKGKSATGFSGYNPTQLFTMYGQRQLEMDMLKFYKFADGSQVSWNRTSPTNPRPLFATTPYWHQYEDYPTDNRKRLYGLTGFDFKPVNWINLSAKVFIDQFNTLREERIARDYTPGNYARTNIEHRELNYQFIATAQKGLGQNLSINAALGGNIMTSEDVLNSASYVGLITPGLYTLTNNVGRLNVGENIFKKKINSVFGTVTLGYKDAVFLDLSGRNDWSSTLAEGNNSYFYPASSLSVIFSQWMASAQKWFSYGKFRASVAQIGSDTDPYRTNVAYNAAVLFGSSPYIMRNPTLANRKLKPERSNEVEAGVELKFLQNRIGIDLTVYNRITNGLIMPLSISNTSGYSSFLTNVGKSRNRGIELQLTGTPLKFKNFSWTIGINYSANRSLLLALDIPNNPNIDRYVLATERRRNSVSVAAIVGQPLFVLTGTDYTYLKGQKVIDNNGFYVPSPGGQVIGNTQPDFVGGVTNSFTYKRFVLSGLIDFQKGGDFFSYTNMYGFASGMLQETVANNIRETGINVSGVLADGTPYTTKVTAPRYFKNNFGTRINKASLYDGSYIYLREVRLGYSLPARWIQAIHSNAATLSLYGRNLWLISSNSTNVDPSNIINSDSNIIGIEGGALPSVRSFGINLNISF